ncbi:MAG: MBL fold metallo-hydrolase [Actinomycetia bacterium]|nr:MBL fold metallo-hydrolase [Actinomycetes bacterium]
MARVRYFGYSTFTIEGNKFKIAIDPGIALPNEDSIIPESDWENVDIVVVTNNNKDHVGKVLELAEKTKAIIVAHEELRESLEKDLIFYGMEPNKQISISEVDIKAISSTYGQSGGGIMSIASTLFKKEPDVKGCIGFLIELDERKICHLGDSILREDWEDWKPDVLMVPIGKSATMTPDEAIDAVEKIKPRVIIPIHYNLPYVTSKSLKVEPQAFKKLLDDRGYDCRILSSGEQIVV